MESYEALSRRLKSMYRRDLMFYCLVRALIPAVDISYKLQEMFEVPRRLRDADGLILTLKHAQAWLEEEVETGWIGMEARDRLRVRGLIEATRVRELRRLGSIVIRASNWWYSNSVPYRLAADYRIMLTGYMEGSPVVFAEQSVPRSRMKMRIYKFPTGAQREGIDPNPYREQFLEGFGCLSTVGQGQLANLKTRVVKTLGKTLPMLCISSIQGVGTISSVMPIRVSGDRTTVIVMVIAET
jgi:hypothetical protein